MPYHGSCHCGRIAFEVDGEPESVLECNCSICSRLGTLLWFVPRENLRLTTPEDALSTYTFHKKVIRRRFCANCGVHAFGEGSDPAGKPMAAINVRCLEGIDLERIPVRKFDGRSL